MASNTTNLSAPTKCKQESQQTEENKVRYDGELRNGTSKCQKRSTKRQKRRNDLKYGPTLPRPAFSLFCDDHVDAVRAEFKGRTAIIDELFKRWESASDVDKEKYKNLSINDEERYIKELDKYMKDNHIHSLD